MSLDTESLELDEPASPSLSTLGEYTENSREQLEKYGTVQEFKCYPTSKGIMLSMSVKYPHRNVPLRSLCCVENIQSFSQKPLCKKCQRSGVEIEWTRQGKEVKDYLIFKNFVQANELLEMLLENRFTE